MPATLPQISVVIATRNRPQTLERALTSVRAQSFCDYEVIVLDDGSDVEVLDEYRRMWQELDGRFVLHKMRAPGERGSGPSASRNHGLRLSRGRYVAFLDDDDWWVKADHLSVAFEAMTRCDADYYFGNMKGVRDEHVEIPDWYPNSPQLSRGHVVNQDPAVYEVPLDAFLATMRHHLVHPNSAIARREILIGLGGFLERVRFAEDYDLMMRIADRVERILYRPDCVAHYRLPSADSVSSIESRLDQTLQQLTCTQHVRAKCVRKAVRHCARSREGWILRDIARFLSAEGRPGAALSFSWQGLCAYPTLGAVVFLGQTLGGVVRSRLGGKQQVS